MIKSRLDLLSNRMGMPFLASFRCLVNGLMPYT